MDDRDFFDLLYQMWTKTTGAEDRYWMLVEYPDRTGRQRIFAADKEETRILVGSELPEPDADWITAVHGCFPDLIRRLNSALDEADRADYKRDERECRIAELEMELQQLEDRCL